MTVKKIYRSLPLLGGNKNRRVFPQFDMSKLFRQLFHFNFLFFLLSGSPARRTIKKVIIMTHNNGGTCKIKGSNSTCIISTGSTCLRLIFCTFTSKGGCQKCDRFDKLI